MQQMVESELARNPSSRSLAGSMSMASFYNVTPDIQEAGDESRREMRTQASHSSLSFLKTAKSEAMDMLHGSNGQHYFMKSAWGIDEGQAEMDAAAVMEGDSGIGAAMAHKILMQKKSQQ